MPLRGMNLHHLPVIKFRIPTSALLAVLVDPSRTQGFWDYCQ